MSCDVITARSSFKQGATDETLFQQQRRIVSYRLGSEDILVGNNSSSCRPVRSLRRSDIVDAPPSISAGTISNASKVIRPSNNYSDGSAKNQSLHLPCPVLENSPDGPTSLAIPEPAITAAESRPRASITQRHNRNVKRRLDFGQDDYDGNMESGQNLSHPMDPQGKRVVQAIFRDHMMKKEQKVAEFRRIWDFCPVESRPLHSIGSEWAWEKISD